MRLSATRAPIRNAREGADAIRDRRAAVYAMPYCIGARMPGRESAEFDFLNLEIAENPADIFIRISSSAHDITPSIAVRSAKPSDCWISTRT